MATHAHLVRHPAITRHRGSLKCPLVHRQLPASGRLRRRPLSVCDEEGRSSLTLLVRMMVVRRERGICDD